MNSISKRISAIILSVIMVFSSLVCGFNSAFAVDEPNDELFKRVMENEKRYSQMTESDEELSDAISTQGVDEFNYLKNKIVKNGKWDSGYNVYYIEKLIRDETYDYYFTINYEVETNRIWCGATLLSGFVYMFLDIDSNEYDGYLVRTTIVDIVEVMGSTVVYPMNYPHDLYFMAYENYGNVTSMEKYQNLLNTGFEVLVDECNELMKDELGINLGNFGFVNLYNPIFISGVSSFTVKYDANGGTGAPSSQTKQKYKALALRSETPKRFGYVFLGWAEDKNAILPEYIPGDTYYDDSNITLYAVWQRDYSVEIYDAKVKIVNNSGTTTQNYKTELVLTAETVDMPQGAYIEWYYNGAKTGTINNQFSVSCTESCLVSVKVVDPYGNVLLDENGKEISDSEKINVNNGFFQRLIAFFRGLFFGNPVVYQ